DEIMAEIFLAFGYEITVQQHLDASEEPEVERIEDLMDTPEEHSESEDEREEDALMELGNDDGEDGLPTDGEDGLPTDEEDGLPDGENGLPAESVDGLPTEAVVLDEAFKGASERPQTVGRPVATPQLRSCKRPDVAVPPAPVATESYEHLGSVSSLCDALDGKLHIGENDAAKEPLDGECIDISDDEQALPSDPAKDALLRKLQELQARLRATAPTADLPATPSVPAPPKLTGSAMDTIETQIDLQPLDDVPSKAPETIEEKPSEAPEPIAEKPSEEHVEDDLLSGLPELGVWEGVSRRDQHSMVALRKEAKAAKKSKKNEGACGPKVKSILKNGKSLRRIKGIKKRIGKAKRAKGRTLVSEP
ncbi:unnamed protein product, partial [Symbiodinium sp. CCMP2456]